MRTLNITDNDDSMSGTPSGYHSRHYGVILELEDGFRSMPC